MPKSLTREARGDRKDTLRRGSMLTDPAAAKKHRFAGERGGRRRLAKALVCLFGTAVRVRCVFSIPRTRTRPPPGPRRVPRLRHVRREVRKAKEPRYLQGSGQPLADTEGARRRQIHGGHAGRALRFTRDKPQSPPQSSPENKQHERSCGEHTLAAYTFASGRGRGFSVNRRCRGGGFSRA